MKKFTVLFLALFAFLLTSLPSYALTDAEYKALIKESEEFRDADESLNEVWKDAKSKLPAEEFKKLQTAQAQWIKKDRGEEAKIFIEGGTSKGEAYYEVTMERIRYINGLIGKAELRKKPYKGYQGLYTYSKRDKQGAGRTGEMSIWWYGYDDGDKTIYAAFENYLYKSKDDANSGIFAGKGEIDGNTVLIIGEHDDNLKAKIVFDGEKATVTTDNAFKQSGELGHGVVLDGVYTRE